MTCSKRENRPHTRGIYCADHETYIDSVLREIYDAYKAARPMQSNRDGGLANPVTKDTVKTKRRPDSATRIMSEQASPSSTGITNSRQYLNFPWIAVNEQSSQSPSSYRSVCDSCILKVNENRVYGTLMLLHTTVPGQLLTTDVPAVVEAKYGGKMLKHRWKFWVFTPFRCTRRRLLSMAQEGAQRIKSRKLPWALLLMLYPCAGHVCRYLTIYCLRFSQCEHVPFSFFSLFTGKSW